MKGRESKEELGGQPTCRGFDFIYLDSRGIGRVACSSPVIIRRRDACHGLIDPGLELILELYFYFFSLDFVCMRNRLHF